MSETYDHAVDALRYAMLSFKLSYCFIKKFAFLPTRTRAGNIVWLNFYMKRCIK